MAAAEVGDDVYGEDPTVTELERTVAAIAGKEQGLFVPSGTMGNLLAIASHCQRGDEIILGYGQHIFQYEGGGASALLGVAFHTIPNQADGTMDIADIEAAVRPDDPHYARTSLVSVENTHNSCGGKVLSSGYARHPLTHTPTRTQRTPALCC
jgi:threonine aldolase